MPTKFTPQHPANELKMKVHTTEFQHENGGSAAARHVSSSESTNAVSFHNVSYTVNFKSKPCAKPETKEVLTNLR